MINSENKNISLGAIVSYITIFASLIISFFYTRFILINLGEINCSIRNIASSATSYLLLISLGMGTSYFRFRKLQEEKEGIEGAKRFNGLFFISYIIFGIAALIIGSFIIIATRFGVFKVEDPSKAYLLVPVISITVVSTALNFPLSVFSIIENYHRKFFFSNLINLIDTILLPILSMAAIYLLKEENTPENLTLIITWIALFESIFIKIIHFIYVKLSLKESISFKIKKSDIKLLKPIVVFSFFAFIVSTISKIHTSTDQVILSSMINTTAALIYSYAILFHTYTNTAITTITGLFTPRLTADAIDNNEEDMRKVFNIVCGAITILLMLIFGGFIVVGKEFITIWLKTLSSLEHTQIYTYGILLISSCVFSVYSNFLFNFHIAKNKHKFSAILYIGSFLLNIVISILLCIPFKILGAIIGTIIVSIIEAIGMTIYTKKILNIQLCNYVNHILINGIISLISITLCLGIFKIFDIHFLPIIVEFFIKGTSFVLIFVANELIFNNKFIKILKNIVIRNKK